MNTSPIPLPQHQDHEFHRIQKSSPMAITENATYYITGANLLALNEITRLIQNSLTSPTVVKMCPLQDLPKNPELAENAIFVLDGISMNSKHLMHIARTYDSTPIFVVASSDDIVKYLPILTHSNIAIVDQCVFGQDISPAIQSLQSQKLFISNTLHFPFLSTLIRSKNQHRARTLNHSYNQMLSLVGQGYDKRQIAAKLELTVPTVSVYLSRMKVQLGLKTQAELRGYAAKVANNEL